MWNRQKVELTNMCMILDGNGNVLVQNRQKSWCGWAFPGGHIEDKESLITSVIREVKEETNLDVSNLVLCGIKHWYKDDVQGICLLYKTSDFSGTLHSTDEGENLWVKLDTIYEHESEFARSFKDTLQVFLNDNLTEHYRLISDEERVSIVK